MDNRPNDDSAEPSEVLGAKNAQQLERELKLRSQELQRAQAELAAARARYFNFYDLAPVGYCTLNGRGHILEVNLTAAHMLGLTCDDLVGRAIQTLIVPQDHGIYHQNRTQLVETGQSQSCTVRMLRTHGKPFWTQLQATLEEGSDPHAPHRLILTDVDERQVAQDRLRVSDIALKAVSQGVLITDAKLHMVWANHAFTAMFGYAAVELQDHDCAVLEGPPTDPASSAAFHTAIQSWQEFSGEFRHYRKDGSCFWNEVYSSPVFDEWGRLIYFIHINTDVSARKRAAQRTQAHNTELQRTAALAVKANLAKSDFLSSMSHELRTPLNSILGCAQLLETGAPDLNPKQHGRLDMILEGGWYLLSLINEILDLAAIESGKLTLALQPVSVPPLLAECIGMVEPDARCCGVRIDMVVPSDEVYVAADPGRLKQVIVNLLSNAIKYNWPSGSVVVKADRTSSQTLRISVQDTGQGLAPELLSQLFVPFNRLGPEACHTQGTGIGLVITKRLTELMGGSVGVRSVVGEGSVFWVDLNTTETAQPPGGGASGTGHGTHPPGPTPLPYTGAVRTILYVEDDSANLDLVAQILADRSDLRLLQARTGREGLAMAQDHRPSLVLMDIDLPDTDGLEVLKMLRLDARTRDIPVVAVSANAMQLDIIHGLSVGFFRYLCKPFQIQNFLETLDQALAAIGPLAGA